MGAQINTGKTVSISVKCAYTFCDRLSRHTYKPGGFWRSLGQLG